MTPAITQLLILRCAQAASMPEGPAERVVEAHAKSADAAEHSETIRGVMAGQRDCQNQDQIADAITRQLCDRTGDQIGAKMRL